MHLDILNIDQQMLMPLLKKFKREYYLVGGTAIALHIGHRLSIDFDLFKNGAIRPKNILTKFQDSNEKVIISFKRDGQLNLLCRDVKFTFFEFEYKIPHPITIQETITIPSLLDLAAMKAFALGMRSKWKDYLDLYFILKNYYSLNEICERASGIFENLFTEKIFRGQLSYFSGISFEEEVEFMPGFEVSEETVKEFLINAALENL